MPIKVLIIDDSAVIRALLTNMIDSDERFKVVGTAVDPYDAREKIKKLAPDVLTLDIEMPKMNGIDFLRNLMRLRPMPVVMISTLTQKGAPATFESLAEGAVDFISKPQSEDEGSLIAYRELILEKVYWASRANVGAPDNFKESKPQRIETSANNSFHAKFLIAIGASTGGTEAIKRVLEMMPANAPPIVLAQHIPEAFSASFARRVNNSAQITVHEAEHNQKIEAGHAYLAPGHSHLRVSRSGAGYVCKLDQSPPVNRHRPSVEVLFDSVLAAAGKSAVSIMLTGMGADGAQAMLRMHRMGCTTIAQDEASSVVWGMPGAAVKLGGVSKVMHLDKIARYALSQGAKK